jgi:hypothetical protein
VGSITKEVVLIVVFLLVCDDLWSIPLYLEGVLLILDDVGLEVMLEIIILIIIILTLLVLTLVLLTRYHFGIKLLLFLGLDVLPYLLLLSKVFYELTDEGLREALLCIEHLLIHVVELDDGLPADVIGAEEGRREEEPTPEHEQGGNDRGFKVDHGLPERSICGCAQVGVCW